MSITVGPPTEVPSAGEATGQRMTIELAAERAPTFEDLFRRRYEPMVRVAFLLVGSRAEAEDVVQDADALATLPPKRRAAVVLRYYAGLREREIADVLGVRPGTVKSMLHRALGQLREVIER
jgi:DNA-directed RNA polymerase specialized sigma24 family protein